MKPTLHLLWTSPNHKLQQVPNKPASLDGNEDYSVDEFCERKTSIQRDDYDIRYHLHISRKLSPTVMTDKSKHPLHKFFYQISLFLSQITGAGKSINVSTDQLLPSIFTFSGVNFHLSLQINASTDQLPFHSFNAVLVFVKDHSCMELQRQASLKFIQPQLLQKMFG